MGAITVTFFLMMLCIGFSVGAAGFFPLAMSISVPLVGFTWLIFLAIRYLPFNGLIKAGIVIAGISLFGYFGSLAIVHLALMSMGSNGVVTYTEPTVTTTVVGVVIGAIFVAIGLITGKKENKNV